MSVGATTQWERRREKELHSEHDKYARNNNALTKIVPDSSFLPSSQPLLFVPQYRSKVASLSDI